MSDMAVIKTGGKQYLVKPGQVLKVEKLSADKAKNTFEFKDILQGKKVSASITSQGKHKKVRIVKFKPKTNYKRVKGHRQHFTEIKIEKIA